jgi:hypothetical protein
VLKWISRDALVASNHPIASIEDKSPVTSALLALMDHQVQKLLGKASEATRETLLKSRSGVTVHVDWQASGLALENYPLNRDEDPLIVTKELSGKPIQYVQEIGIRYLR